MAFNQQYNTDNVFLRSVIVGLLDLLNKRMQIMQVKEDTEEAVPVPFFYARYGSERFLQDFFMYYMKHPELSCDVPQIVEGGVEPVPRGSLSATGMSVNAAALTSKFVRGTYNKEVNGEVIAHSSMLNMIPLTINFDVQIIGNNLLESMKIVQAAIGSFYKAAKFNVEYRGFMVACQVGFSEEYRTEKQLQFSYGDGEDRVTVSFSMEVETYMPVPDQTTERWRGNVMDGGIGNNLTLNQDGTLSADFDVQVRGTDPRFPKPDDPDARDTNGNPL
jgi:hypothetical protein